MTIPEMASAPIMPISSVLMLATMARPEEPPTSAEKSTPKVGPHWESIVETK